jgi:hypothetical protein
MLIAAVRDLRARLGRRKQTVLAAAIVLVAAVAVLMLIRPSRPPRVGEEPPPAVVAAAPAQEETWEAQLGVVGTLSAVHGVHVTTEVGGLVSEIHFDSGKHVKKGERLIDLGVVTLNIYTQVALLALVSSIIRHGILIVEFANQVQRADRIDRRAAVQKAARIRLRPIVMTTLATLFGMVPLIFAGGPGAESRFSIGFVLGAGMAVGTIFTLFVGPALYAVLAREHRVGERKEDAMFAAAGS